MDNLKDIRVRFTSGEAFNLFAVQGDAGTRGYRARLIDPKTNQVIEPNPDYVFQIIAERPDNIGKYIVTDGTIDGDSYVVYLSTNMLIEPGPLNLQLILKDGESAIRSDVWTINIPRALDIDGYPVQAEDVLVDFTQLRTDLDAIGKVHRVFSAGRPDKPETTVFSATELDAMPIGTEFVSSDGANAGAWVWTKFGREDEPNTPATAKGWTVTSGDTGNVIVTPTNITGGAKIVFRRVNNTIFSSLGFQGPWGTFGIDENAIALEGTKFELGVTPQGFGTNIAQTMLLSRDGKELITDAVYNVLNRTPDGGKIQIRCKDATAANNLKGQTLLRAASIRWVTNESWPESI